MVSSTTLSETAVSPIPAPKRTATSLLPAFEPFSSSPALPRPLKRNRDAFDEHTTYPTPVPTSSTAILTSSPSRVSKLTPALRTNVSTLSERTPLGSLPCIQLQVDGKITRLGRSSASCDYQLSANRLISRVHVEACYKSPGSRLGRELVEITCTGWNGVKIHCKGQAYELKKGETFQTDVRDAEIILDVHDSRVVVEWPPKPRLGAISSDEDEDVSPTKRQRVMLRHSTPPSPSPLQSRRRPASPISPSPAVQALLASSPPGQPSRPHVVETVEIYEDPETAQDGIRSPESVKASQTTTQALSQPAQMSTTSQNALSSSAEDFSDNDEENDPIIHSFGRFGANLLPRLASFNTGDSPNPSHTNSVKSSRSSHTEPLHPQQPPAHNQIPVMDFDIQGHIINQLAFSRLSSTPLSTILSHLPQEAGVVSLNDVRKVVSATACIGEVRREGKDAAGKALESEFYYLPDLDEDDKRKEAVVMDLRKPGLRACRKQHKVGLFLPTVFALINTRQQYYWRKPK